MKNTISSFCVVMALMLLVPAFSGRAQVYADSSTDLEKYMVPATTPNAIPDA